LLNSHEPIKARVAWHGPNVMATREESKTVLEELHNKFSMCQLTGSFKVFGANS